MYGRPHTGVHVRTPGNIFKILRSNERRQLQTASTVETIYPCQYRPTDRPTAMLSFAGLLSAEYKQKHYVALYSRTYVAGKKCRLALVHVVCSDRLIVYGVVMPLVGPFASAVVPPQPLPPYLLQDSSRALHLRTKYLELVWDRF